MGAKYVQAEVMEGDYKQTQKVWNEIARRYEEKFMDFELYNRSYEDFCELISAPKPSVLEIGCGPGNITKHLHRLLPKAEILATDASQNMIELCQKNLPSVAVQKLDCRNLNSIQHNFDAIVCGFTIPYLSKKDLELFIEQCQTHLNNKGLMYLSFVERNYSDSGYIGNTAEDQMYFHYYQKSEVESILTKNSLSVVSNHEFEYTESDGRSETHIALIARLIQS